MDFIVFLVIVLRLFSKEEPGPGDRLSSALEWFMRGRVENKDEPLGIFFLRFLSLLVDS